MKTAQKIRDTPADDTPPKPGKPQDRGNAYPVKSMVWVSLTVLVLAIIGLSAAVLLNRRNIQQPAQQKLSPGARLVSKTTGERINLQGLAGLDIPPGALIRDEQFY